MLYVDSTTPHFMGFWYNQPKMHVYLIDYTLLLMTVTYIACTYVVAITSTMTQSSYILGPMVPYTCPPPTVITMPDMCITYQHS